MAGLPGLREGSNMICILLSVHLLACADTRLLPDGRTPAAFTLIFREAPLTGRKRMILRRGLWVE
jgi:hypothetical protein